MKAAVLSLAVLGTRPLAAAEPDSRTRSAARTLGTSGVEAYQAGDYTDASEKLERAYAALKVPSLGLWSARALIRLNRWVEASERLVEVGRLEVTGGDAAVQKAAKADAESELNALTPRLPSVVVELKGAAPTDASVTIDDRPLASPLVGTSVPIDPGNHIIRAQLAEQHAEQRVTLKEAETKHVALALEPSSAKVLSSNGGGNSSSSSATSDSAQPPPINDHAAEPSHLQRNVALGVGALGVVGIAIGSVYYFKASGSADEARGICPSNVNCRSEDIERHNQLESDVKSQRTVSYVGFGVGGALLATGVVVFLTAPSDTAQASRSGIRVGFSSLPEGGYFGSLGGSFE